MARVGRPRRGARLELSGAVGLPLGQEQATERLQLPAKRQAYEPLEWYAKRGLLVGRGEAEALAEQRVEAALRFQLLVERGQMRPRVTRALSPVMSTRQLRSDDRVERLTLAALEARKRVAKLLLMLAPESREVVQDVLIHRRFAGSAGRLAALREGLSALHNIFTKKHKKY